MRVDLYGTVHKGLRARLFDLGVELDRCDFTKPLEVAVAMSAYRRTMGFVHEHHHHEDEFIEPVLQPCGGDIASSVAAQHSRMHTSLAELDALVAAIDRSPDDRRATGAVLCGRFRTFLAEYLQHMDYEETVVNAGLWATCSDPDLMALHGRLHASIPMPRFIEWLEILLPAINFDERTAMLRGLKAHAPTSMFEAVTSLASRVLGPAGWDAVRGQL